MYWFRPCSKRSSSLFIWCKCALDLLASQVWWDMQIIGSAAFLSTTQCIFRTCCYLTLKENGTDVVLFTVPQFSTPLRTHDKRDRRFTDPHCKWKWEAAAHWAIVFKKGTWRRRGWWKMHHGIVRIINGYVSKAISNFSSTKLHFSGAGLAWHASLPFT